MTPPTRHRRVTLAVASALSVLLLITGCTVSAKPDQPNADGERNASAWLGIEVCFTNTLPAPVNLATTYNGTYTRWEQTLKPAETLCTRTTDSAQLLKGTLAPQSESTGFSFRFANPNLGYPNGSIIAGTSASGASSGPGLCMGFKSLETGVYDTGTTRFTMKRLEDSADFKQFRVTIGASQQTVVPESGCLYN